MQAMPAAYLQQRRSLVHTAVQMADTLELPVGGGCVAGAQATHPQLLCISGRCCTLDLLGPWQLCLLPVASLTAWWVHWLNQMQSCCSAAISCSSVLTTCRAAWSCSTAAH